MAKHPHKLIFLDRKTWKCMECSFFVHKGLTHILLGKSAICWDCEEPFVIDGGALKEDKPRCADCRQVRIIESIPEPTQEIKEPEMNEAKRKIYRELGLIK